MKNVYQQKRQEGFTIIEVLIVLAIAAVILLIVFLAVPALQRNSRNNGIRNDAAGVLAGVNDYVANNNGTQPTGVTVTGNIVSITGTGTAAEAKVRGGTSVSLTVTAPGAASCSASMPTGTQTGTVVIATNCKCNQAGNAFLASARATAAGFLTEVTSGGGTAPQCIES
ncbi:prepilin-type N-terminal cleavage/methylation domain-containing protein [Candidatus Saccharibacteria bacterium]|nr:prepilin-type N-terminal cleavage/methylation domain-containing protein [Candidatus Saccharibacteria bacterium]